MPVCVVTPANCIVQCVQLIDNIKMGILEIGLSSVDWIGLAQNRYRWRAVVNAVMNLRVP
jgi:hypothetical protein